MADLCRSFLVKRRVGYVLSLKRRRGVLQRLPKDADSLREFPAKLYNAPVAPLRRLDERSLDGVVINSMQLMRTG